MTQGETIIAFLLGIIAFFLYHIAKQLSYLTGKRIKISFYNPYGNWIRKKPHKKEQKEPIEKLPN